MLSHVDHFIAAGQTIFESMYDKAMKEEPLTHEDVYNLARQGLSMMFCAGMGVQDLARNSIWQIGEQMTTRRDVFLERIQKESNMPMTNIEELRFASLNTPDLFERRALDRAIEKTAEARHDKVQTKVLTEISKISQQGTTQKSSSSTQ